MFECESEDMGSIPINYQKYFFGLRNKIVVFFTK